MFNWEPIFNDALHDDTKLVYLSVGSAMDDCDARPVTDDTNQQYPPFINKFKGRKLSVLLDPYLEEHLAVEKYMETHHIPFEKKVYDDFCILRSHDNDIIVYAIKETFSYEPSLYGTPEEITQSIYTTDSNVSNLINLIHICLEKRIKTKLILQDFTGRDLTKFYYSLFNTFDKTDLLNHVMFDVTQKDGGCLIEMNEHQANINEHGNFIQEKYLQLVQLNTSPLFKRILIERINRVIYPLAWDFSNLKNNPPHQIVNKDTLLFLASIYNIDIDELNNNPDYLIHKYERLIRQMLEDIVNSQNSDLSAVDYLISIIDNRTDFNNTLMIFKFN